ncbi:MAG: hypothetical protein KKB03_01690 [Nanoarchaeota archaeon]|nr:hypothetical protein [Nanoarchaeota archaeon]MBU2519938.1 hypothetical protein [Nanoarchaeota archaeon]
MIKYWRLMILIVCLLGSILAIGFKIYPYGREGVEITYISLESPARNMLEQGMIITHINGQQVINVEEWQRLSGDLSGTIEITANAKPYTFSINDTIGIDVMDIERTNMEFGLDIRGGTRIILKPTENATAEVIDEVISTLQTRANIYGLREMRFYSIRGLDGNYYLQIEAAGVSKDIVDELLSRQGSFEAKVSKPVILEGDQGIIVLGDKSYSVSLSSDDSIQIETVDDKIELSDTFILKGIDFQYLNATEDGIMLLATTYTGKDIELVYSDPQRSGIRPFGEGYSFYFAILVSNDGAQRFADVTSGIPKHIDLVSGEEYIDSQIFLFIDGSLVSQLNIGSSLGGHVYNSPQIQGSRETLEEATEEKFRMQTILRSGALPTTLETSSIDIISPTLGAGFFQSAAIAALFGGAVIVIITFIRYRKIKVSVPLVLIGLSEVVIIMGIAATNDMYIWGIVMLVNLAIILTAWWKKEPIDFFAWAGALLIPILGMMSWTIDLPAIGGIIAAIGTGVDHQIIIADETIAGRKKEDENQAIFDVKDRIKKAFFIIFGAAATTIAAMVPLMSLGIGLVRGFAITTVVGVLVGILITRPAYAKIIERVVKR